MSRDRQRLLPLSLSSDGVAMMVLVRRTRLWGFASCWLYSNGAKRWGGERVHAVSRSALVLPSAPSPHPAQLARGLNFTRCQGLDFRL